LPGAEVVVLDGIGHTPHLTQPAFVGERLAAWVRDTAPAPVAERVAWKVERPTSHA
jgi:pimeloyl-ACP methyl ester carboxylesterase